MMGKRQTPVTKTQKSSESLCSLNQKPAHQPQPVMTQQVAPQLASRYVQFNANKPRAADLLALQRTVGNRQVQRMVARRRSGQRSMESHPIATSLVQKAPTKPSNLDRLRELLRDDQENQAIALMRQLSSDEKAFVLNSREFKELAISAFDNDEMYRAMDALGGDLYKSLEWMFDEGTAWSKVRALISQARPGKDRVRADNWMKEQFVDICNDAEMAEAVDLLGGTLVQKFRWMQAEGSSWGLVKAKLQRTTNAAEKTALYGSTAMRDFFVDVCDDNEMAEAVDLLGGTLLQKLTWMKAEDANWKLVKAKLQATTDAAQKTALYTQANMRAFFVDVCNDEEMAEAVDLLGGTLLQKLTWMQAEDANWKLVKAKLQRTTDAAEKTALYGSTAMRDFFVDVCNNKEMAEAVQLIGGALVQKLQWMLAEGTDADLVYNTIRLAPSGELPAVLKNTAGMDGLKRELSKEEFQRVQQMLSQGLLKWEEKKFSYEEKHYEQNKKGAWELQTFGETARYEIQYTRTALKIIVRIKLTGVPASTALKTTWITGIQNRWNNQFHIENDRKLQILVEPIFTTSNAHHTIEVHNPPPTGVTREDSGNFYTTTTGDTAAHELGHLIGLEDEYNLSKEDYERLTGKPVPPGPAPASGYTATGLMGTVGSLQDWHLSSFVKWLNSHRLPGEKPYKLVPGP